jgi:integrase
MAERFLLGRGMAVDAPTLEKFCGEIVKATRDAATTNARKAAGDFSEGDPLGRRFGEPWSGVDGAGKPTVKPSKASDDRLSLRALLQAWRDDPQRRPSPATHAAYAAAIDRFIAFVGHDDARRVTPEDVLKFRRHRLGEVSPKTVRDGDLAGLKSIFSWAIQEGVLPGANPVAGIKVVVPAKEVTRADGQGFSDEEALAILSMAFRYTRGVTEKAKTAAAKRWVPWLMAYSGARVGEFAQLRKQDVRQHEAGFWYARLTPDAGPIKDRKARDVPLHSHLVEMGFIEFVQAAAEGHLFLDPTPPAKRLTGSLRNDDERGVRGPLQGIKNRLAEFARQAVRDPEVSPNHGWRHRVKTIAFAVGEQERVIDEIQGQSSGTVSRSYGKITLERKHEAVEKLPRYEV